MRFCRAQARTSGGGHNPTLKADVVDVFAAKKDAIVAALDAIEGSASAAAAQPDIGDAAGIQLSKLAREVAAASAELQVRLHGL